MQGSGDDDTRVLALDDADADDVFDVLAARTRREFLASLYEEPSTTSDLADRHDTSLQNTSYHLEKLQEAGLVEVAGTWYSEQGTEMNVYAPTNAGLVLFAGGEESKSVLTRALTRLFGAVALVAVLGVLVQGLVTRLPLGAPASSEADAGGGQVSTMAVSTADTQPSLLDRAVEFLSQPGVEAFLLGTGVLLVLFALWYARVYRPRRGRAA
ncbi:transcriptional regulator [Halocalculus aciditolerans]|uniref:Transcriptional regulator n=1 Tax=Halocalculus aciditolerans TaxID=1383812 RepID=A0A830FB29_9EURY|nr:transcriptional regulator [Halocalculus aciditolerans]